MQIPKLRYIVPILFAISALITWSVYHQPSALAQNMQQVKSIDATVVNMCGELSADTTWQTDVIYVFTCDVTIKPGVHLTIQPGVIVKSQSPHSLIVQGKLTAIGSADNKIYFTSYQDDSVGGDTNNDGVASTPATRNWGAIQFMNGSDSDSSLRYVELRYGGGEYYWNLGAIFLYSSASPVLAEITFYKNYINGVELQGGVEWLTDSWDNVGVPYVFQGDITIPERNILTIAPGVLIKGTPNNSLIVRGRLAAEGEITKPITITTLTEDILNDTNNDGTASAPASRGWGSIQFMPESDSSSVVKNVELRYGGGEYYWNVAPIFFYASASPVIQSISFYKNYINGVELQGAVNWLTDSWDNVGVPYVFRGDITIAARNTLTITPGMVLQGVRDQSLIVSGKLIAEGKSESWITFTSLTEDFLGDTNNDGTASSPSTGGWGTIMFMPESEPDSVLEYVQLRYGGREYYWDVAPIFFYASVSPIIGDVVFHKNYINGIELQAGVNWLSTSWDNPKIPYVFRGDITVPELNMLAIKPGVILKGTVDNSIIVEGSLQAKGEPNDPIYFTSLNDDSIGGDTNNDGIASSPAPSQWGHIRFTDSSDDQNSVIENSIIRYGGREYYWNVGAIYLDNASPRLSYNTLISNYRGVETINSSIPLLECNNIYRNSDFGLINDTVSNPILAENQWWGDVTGPFHATNALGKGQKVSDGIDFTPWAVTTCSGLPPIPTDTPTITPTSTNTPTPCPTDSSLVNGKCATITPTFTPTATDTPTPTPSPTPTNTLTPTMKPTVGPTPTIQPTLTSVLPNQGSNAEPNVLTVNGGNFQNGATVTLGGTALTTTFIDSEQVRADVPVSFTVGMHDLTLTNPDGGKATLANAYTVFDAADNDDLFGNDYELLTEPLVPLAGSQTLLRLKVHRQGGKQALANVVVRFYLGDPNAGGTVIGDGTVALLSPDSAANNFGVGWTPSEAKEYTIFAVIDPNKQVKESFEDNNGVKRTLLVLPPAADTVAPHVDSFTINDGAETTQDRTVRLNTTASDPAPGTGVAKLLFVEFEYSQGADDWVPVRVSDWLDYESNRTNHNWSLVPVSGLKYLQAWAADGAGNISLFPFNAYINYLPSLERVGKGQRKVYFFDLKANDVLKARLEPVSGDPDLYIWSEDDEHEPPWVSNLPNAVDDLTVTDAKEGRYQVQVHGFSAAEYRLIVTINANQLLAVEVGGGIDPNKVKPDSPLVAMGNDPPPIGIPAPEPTGQPVFLPLIQR